MTQAWKLWASWLRSGLLILYASSVSLLGTIKDADSFLYFLWSVYFSLLCIILGLELESSRLLNDTKLAVW